MQLSIPAVPLNWPIGTGRDFQGVFDLRTNQVVWSPQLEALHGLGGGSAVLFAGGNQTIDMTGAAGKSITLGSSALAMN